MAFLDKFRKKKNQESQVKRQFENSLLEIVRMVSFDDADTLKSAQECVSDTKGYCKNHGTDYEDRGMSEDDEITFLQWIGCIDLLLQNRFVCECDWKEEKDNFVFQIDDLRGMQLLSLKIEGKWFDENQEITEWCAKLEEKWKKSDVVMAAFDIESDSYVMFPCKRCNLETLSELAEEFGYRIDYAKNM